MNNDQSNSPLNFPQTLPLNSEVKTQVGGRFYQYRGFILVVLLLLTLWLNYTFLLPLVMGAVFATVLHPMMRWFNKSQFTRRFSNTWRAGIITLAFTLIILIPVGLLVFGAVQAIIEKVATLNTADFTAQNISFKTVVNDLGLQTTVDRLYDYLPVSEAQVQQYATKGAAAAAAFGANMLQNLITSIPGLLFQNFVLILTLFFLLVDGPRAVQFLRNNSIFNREQTDHLIHTTSLLCNSVIVATLASGAVQSAIVALICIFTGVHGVLMYTFITLISSFLPVVGTAPMIVFLSIKAFIAGESGHGIIWLLAIPVVGTSDNVVRPYVLKGGAELHPLVGFVAAFGALDMIGFYGLFIGPIVAGLFFTLLPMVTKTYPRQRISASAR